NLRIPGPTPCPPEVLDQVGEPMINHRGPEFKVLINSVTAKLKRVFQTREDLFILTSSGTGAMEASIVNTLSPGDPVLCVSVGAFGDRYRAIAEAYGLNVTRMDVEWGKIADPNEIRKALKANPAIKAVIITHNETSTGVTNDLAAISKVVKGEFNKLLLVDAISSMGCLPLPTDEWRIDVVGTSSQKGFMVPPGLAFISFGQQAWQAYASAKLPRNYFDLKAAKHYLEDLGQTPWTPAVSIFYGLDISLDMMLAEGLESVFARHHRLAEYTRQNVKAMGLSLYADESCAADTVTAVTIPEGVDGNRLVGLMREEHNVVLAGGQGKLVGKIFRIGHLGHCSEEDLRAVFVALEAVLPKVGFKPKARAR
ncbi:MAG: alanine--glyoxylate aminotransferase family protein, partial [Chloroflexota bacterium]|nr:alanine--glyoxylate aminotransferase family protein [Chloroflexota bacterium]